MIKRQLGKSGPAIGALGLGSSAASDGANSESDRESIATIQAALDAGINMLNTADFYGMGHSELLIGEAIKGRRIRRSFR